MFCFKNDNLKEYVLNMGLNIIKQKKSEKKLLSSFQKKMFVRFVNYANLNLTLFLYQKFYLLFLLL